MTDPVLYYVEDFTDEVIPCKPTLESWAEWLAAPSEDHDGRPPAKDGKVFAVFTMTRFANSTARHTDEGWVLDPPAPTDADFFAVATASSWDIEEGSGTTAAEALELFDHDDEVELAVCRDDPVRQLYRFEADGPRLVLVGSVQ